MRKKITTIIGLSLLGSVAFAKEVTLNSIGVNLGLSHTYYIVQDLDVSTPNTNLFNVEAYTTFQTPIKVLEPTLSYIYAKNDDYNTQTIFLGLNKIDTFKKFSLYHGFLLGYSSLHGTYTSLKTKQEEKYSHNDFSAALQAGLKLPLFDNLNFNLNTRYLLHSDSIDLHPKYTAKFTHNGTISILFGLEYLFSHEKEEDIFKKEKVENIDDYDNILIQDDNTSDKDKDGVIDILDSCPNSAKGEIVDSFGCAKDGDHDGVIDRIDKCPNSIEYEIVDDKGCALDSDGDGVIDRVDMCSFTPKGEIVDKNGCPKDSDNDGVIDRIDKCPNTPKDVDVNQYGCQSKVSTFFTTQQPSKKKIQPKITQKKESLKKKKTIIQKEEKKEHIVQTHPDYTLRFGYKSDTLTKDSDIILKEIIQKLHQNKSLRIILKSYTDSIGSDKYNLLLAKKRSHIILQKLIDAHIQKRRVMIENLGEKDPIASNLTEEGRAKNRRVEVYFVTPY